MFKRRSTEGMSFTLAAVSLVCSSLWMSYGVMLDNAFIYVPNVMGVLFSISQVYDGSNLQSMLPALLAR